MLPKEKIDRINELAKKAKTQELTKEEKEEQRQLRMEFLADFRERFKKQLDNIDIQYVEDLEDSDKPN